MHETLTPCGAQASPAHHATGTITLHHGTRTVTIAITTHHAAGTGTLHHATRNKALDCSTWAETIAILIHHVPWSITIQAHNLITTGIACKGEPGIGVCTTHFSVDNASSTTTDQD